MPVRAVTTRFMYKGLCTIPDVLSYRTPVNLPEDEVEGECLRLWFQFVIGVLRVYMQRPPAWQTSSAPRRAPPAGVRVFSSSANLTARQTVGLHVKWFSSTDVLHYGLGLNGAQNLVFIFVSAPAFFAYC